MISISLPILLLFNSFTKPLPATLLTLAKDSCGISILSISQTLLNHSTEQLEPYLLRNLQPFEYIEVQKYLGVFLYEAEKKPWAVEINILSLPLSSTKRFRIAQRDNCFQILSVKSHQSLLLESLLNRDLLHIA